MNICAECISRRDAIDRAGWHENSRNAIEVPKEDEVVSLHFPSALEMRSRSSSISLENVSYKYPKAAKPALQDVNLIVHPGDRIDLLGLNGVGKNTLVELLTSTLRPASGNLQTYPRLKVGFYSQHIVDDLAKKKRLTRIRKMSSRGRDPSPSVVETIVCVLSG
jgi:ATP-binding cassette subfamily F protein 3